MNEFQIIWTGIFYFFSIPKIHEQLQFSALVHILANES